MRKEYINLGRKFEIFGGETRLENPWIKVVDYHTRTDNRDGRYTVIERKDAAIIILEHPRLGVLMINSYRYPIAQTSWELPGGGIEHDEDPVQAAIRELEEETGIEGVTLQPLGSFLPIPGLTPQRVYIFYGKISDNIAEKAVRFRQPEDEIIERRFISREELKSMIKTHQIQDGLTLVALSKLKL